MDVELDDLDLQLRGVVTGVHVDGSSAAFFRPWRETGCATLVPRLPIRILSCPIKRFGTAAPRANRIGASANNASVALNFPLIHWMMVSQSQ